MQSNHHHHSTNNIMCIADSAVGVLPQDMRLHSSSQTCSLPAISMSTGINCSKLSCCSQYPENRRASPSESVATHTSTLASQTRPFPFHRTNHFQYPNPSLSQVADRKLSALRNINDTTLPSVCYTVIYKVRVWLGLGYGWSTAYGW